MTMINLKQKWSFLLVEADGASLKSKLLPWLTVVFGTEVDNRQARQFSCRNLKCGEAIIFTTCASVVDDLPLNEVLGVKLVVVAANEADGVLVTVTFKIKPGDGVRAEVSKALSCFFREEAEEIHLDAGSVADLKAVLEFLESFLSV